MNRVVHKFGTGQAIPEGAKYLNTVTQTQIWIPERQEPGFTSLSGPDAGQTWTPAPTPAHYEQCWLVWHYYEVEA